jgi:SAM-dependent methyltransferase
MATPVPNEPVAGAPAAHPKRTFYSRPAVAGAYDALRFAGPSGAHVNQRELALIRQFLPPAGKVLDLACGTGRLTAALTSSEFDPHSELRTPNSELPFRVFPLDPSPEMLRATRARPGLAAAPAVQADGFSLPFAPAAFDAVAALRLLFHYAALDPLLAEMGRVVRPGGSVIFDTFRWTPRSLVPLLPGRFGGKVHIHRRRPLLAAAAAAGLTLTSAEDCFLFSPYVYRLLPLPLVRALDRLEPLIPPRLRARTFWQFTRI